MEELNNINLSLYGTCILHWKTEEKCRLKLKSIEDIEKSTIQANKENEELEKQLHNAKLRIVDVRDNIVSIDRTIICLYEILAQLEVQLKKKEFAINKSRGEHELQIFIRMELYEKEEERLKNIPEIKDLKMVDSELENLKIEYENLINHKENVVEEINKAKKKNCMMMNDIVVEFAKVYVEMISLNKINEHCTTLLSNLETEYNEKLRIKNSLLQSQKKKNYKFSFWTHDIPHMVCQFNSKTTVDNNLNSLNQNLKPNFTLKNDSYQQKLDNKQNNNLNFLSSEDKISDTNNDNLNVYESSKTNLVESNILSNNGISTNVSLIKTIPEINVTTDQVLTNYQIQSNKMNAVNNEQIMNVCNLDLQTNKRTKIEPQRYFEFKKPYYSEKEKISIDQNTKTVQPKTSNKGSQNIIPSKAQSPSQLSCLPCPWDSTIVNQEKDQILNVSINHYNYIKNSDYDNSIQENGSLELVKKSDSIENNTDNINMFHEMSQFNENPSQEQNNALQDLFWNDYGEQELENMNTSFCGSDVSELFETPYDNSHNQYSDTQLHLLNSIDSNLESICKSNTHESKITKPQYQSENLFAQFNDNSFKNINTSNNTSMNETTSRLPNDFMKLNRPHFGSSEQLKLIFNNFN